MTSPKLLRHDTRKIVRGTPHEEMVDELAVEEPLEIRVNNETWVQTLRTPGDDLELAVGMLVTQGVIKTADQLGSVRHVTDAHHPDNRNVVNVTLANGAKLTASRQNFSTATLGVCGKAAIENAKNGHHKAHHPKMRLKLDMLYTLPQTLRKAQTVFEKTGALAAAALFDTLGTLLGLREDVDRQHAVDKLVGNFFMNDKMPLDKYLLLVSGRAGFDILHRAHSTQIPVVCAGGAPSSLAVHFAQAAGMTLVGYMRADAYNVYAGAERIEV